MKEGTVPEIEFELDKDVAPEAAPTARPAFTALVALWFAALFGVGCLLLPPVLFDAIFQGNPPFGPQTRVVFALLAAGIGLLMGLFIASRLRVDRAEKPAISAPTTRRRDARPPLDVRAALGLSDYDDEDDDDDDLDAFDDDADIGDMPDHDAFDLTDVVSPPIDDPYFASAWSDADVHRARHVETGDEPTPSPQAEPADQSAWDAKRDFAQSDAKPIRYNPFAEFVTPDDEEPENEAEQQPLAQEAPPAWEPAPEPSFQRTDSVPPAPPPPPAWPQPRAEEPALADLGVAELVERLARALQGEHGGERPQPYIYNAAPPRSGAYRHESALAQETRPAPDLDQAMRSAIERLSRLDDVA